MYKSFDDIPDHYVEFLKEQEEYSFFSGFHWFKYLAETTLQAHEKLAIYGLEGCTPTPTLDALFVGRSPAGQNGSVLQKRRISGNSLASLTNYQSPRFSVLVSPSVVAPATAVAQLAEQICQDEMGWRLIDINLIERESPIFANLVYGFRRAGMVARPYFHKGNWYETTPDKSFDMYVKKLPPSSRKAIQNYVRKARKLERSGRMEFRIFLSSHGLEDAISDYETIYAASWKEPEPYPHFIPNLIRATSALGGLRLGIVYLDGKPVASEFVIVWNGCASMMKTAYDINYRNESVGAIAILMTLQCVLDKDDISTIDFGPDDDKYKRIWVSKRRELWGVTAFDPRSFAGLRCLVEQMAIDAVRRGKTVLKSVLAQSGIRTSGTP